MSGSGGYCRDQLLPVCCLEQEEDGMKEKGLLAGGGSSWESRAMK